MKVGDPAEKGTTTGALVSKEHLEKVKYYIELAVHSENGKIECGHTVDTLDLPDKLNKVCIG